MVKKLRSKPVSEFQITNLIVYKCLQSPRVEAADTSETTDKDTSRMKNHQPKKYQENKQKNY